MHETVLQVLQSLNVMLVLPGWVKGGLRPAASIMGLPQRPSWVHDHIWNPCQSLPGPQGRGNVWGSLDGMPWGLQQVSEGREAAVTPITVMTLRPGTIRVRYAPAEGRDRSACTCGNLTSKVPQDGSQVKYHIHECSYVCPHIWQTLCFFFLFFFFCSKMPTKPPLFSFKVTYSTVFCTEKENNDLLSEWLMES